MRFFALAGSLLVCLTLGCGSSSTGEKHLAFDGEKAFAEIEAQVAFGPRVPGSPGHSACASYLVRKLSESADTVWTDRWSHVTSAGDTLPLVNIGASFNTANRHRVLLCAHWDTRPVAEHDPDPAKQDQPIPGANDGGSGVAVLLELARIFSAEPPEVGVDIVLFDGEDYGDFYENKDVLLGSLRFASRARGYRNLLGILLDMVGDRNAGFPYEGYSWNRLPADVRLIWDTAENLGYGSYFVRQVGPAVLDDHIPLLDRGIRCIDIVQMGLPYWHTHADTPDKCSPATLEAVGRTVAAVLYGLPSKN